METIWQVTWGLSPYLEITLIVIVGSMLFTIIFGTIISLSYFVKIKFIQWIYIFFVGLMRATPILLLLMLIFYGLPILTKVIGIDMSSVSKLTFAIIAIGLENSAYFAENLIGAYSSIDKTQYEVSQSFHLGKINTIRRILGPQIFYAVLPNVGNTLIAIIKGSAYVYVIGMVDIYEQAQVIAQVQFGKNQVIVFLILSTIYWILCSFVQWILGLIEKKRKWKI